MFRIHWPGLLRLLVIVTVLAAVFMAGVVMGQGASAEDLCKIFWRTYF